MALQPRRQTPIVDAGSVDTMNAAAMGCTANVPGKSEHNHLRISLSGAIGKLAAPVYVAGRQAVTLRGNPTVDGYFEIADCDVDTLHGRAGKA
jgi:4-hydroxy-3-methylbut-2-en-1-yl diphosphate synthase IspG/GcpE